MWSPHTGLLGLEGDERGGERGGERGEEERSRSRNREKERERAGHGDDHAVSLEGGLNSGSPPGTNSWLRLVRTYVTDTLVYTCVTDIVPVLITVLHPHYYSSNQIH